MKKLLGLFLCMLMFVGITACDDSAQNVKMDSGDLIMLGSMIEPDHTYPELCKLSGTSWQKQDISYFLNQYDNNADGTDVILQIPLVQLTTTLNFNSNGTFTATYENRYLAAWDARYVAAGVRFYTTVASPNDASAQTDHESSTNAAFTGYAGNYRNGNSRIEITGTWRRVKVESIMGYEDNYTWDYEVKVLRTVSYTYTIDETATNYTVSNSVFRDQTWTDEDADWNAAIAQDSLGAGGDNDGTELDLTLSGALNSLPDGVYTKL